MIYCVPKIAESFSPSHSAQENLKKKEQAHDIMSKRLEIAEALSTRTVNELSEKEKMIQEQAKLTEEK